MKSKSDVKNAQVGLGLVGVSRGFFIVAIKLKETTASDLFRRLDSYSKQHKNNLNIRCNN